MTNKLYGDEDLDLHYPQGVAFLYNHRDDIQATYSPAQSEWR